MPTETLPAEDMEAARTRLEEMNLNGGERHWSDGVPKSKKTRSDKGTKRPEKPKPAPAGVLADGQWARINVLANLREQARLAQFQAEENYKRAAAEFDDYMSTIRFKRDV